MSENHGPRLSHRVISDCKTYLAMIAFTLQESPGKMLTFTQLMDRLEGFVSTWTKSFENNIRACLSTYKCFVKVPNSPEADATWNYNPNCWKLDHSKITEKMVHRHFKGLLEWFPELTSTERKEMLTTPPPPPDHYTTLISPAAAACKAVNSRCEVMFSSSFSIDSILKKDSPSSVSVKVEQKPRWSTERTVGLKRKFNGDSLPVDQCTGASYSSYTTGSSTDHGLTGNDAAKRKRMITMTPLSQQEKFNHCKTYLAMITFIVQDSPKKMLTFTQVMDRLEAFGLGRTKSFENNIRVCLSTNKCFVKIPMGKCCLWNYWKVDSSKITQKILRRHFEGILGWFPELTSVRKDMSAVNSRCEMKFSSSFSIESILNIDR